MKTLATMGNVPYLLLDDKKGGVTNRLNAAGETLKNNVVNGTKFAATVATTGLVADTFAGNKTVLNAVKTETKNAVGQLAEKVATKFPAVKKCVNVVKTEMAKALNTPVMHKMTNALKNDVSALADKILASPIVKNINKHKGVAIIGAGITVATGILMKWANQQGRIDQKYEDKAVLQEHLPVL